MSLLPLLSPLLLLALKSSYPGLQAASLLVTSVGVEPPVTSYEVAATYGLDPQRSCLPLLHPPLPFLAPNQAGLSVVVHAYNPGSGEAEARD